MSRLRQFARGVGSSWLATFATVAYSLLSVPIALTYLRVEEFGLFALVLQISSYFTLAEVGMSAATARFLVDYKDYPDDGKYGSVILTGFWVFLAQGFAILVVGILGAPWLVNWVGVPDNLRPTAVFLLQCLAVTSAIAMAFRIYGAVLYANKRLDLIHAFMGANVLFALVLLTSILASGGGLLGLAWLFFGQAVVAIILPIIACFKLGLLPNRGCWGRASMARFRDLFGFGKDVFVVNVGNQVLEASQLIIITRTMGLNAAAVWSVSTKLLILVYQLTTKIEGTAIVFFAEMMVRGEMGKLATRFRQIYQLTAGISVVALAGVVAINRPFVSVWAEPSLAWSNLLSVMMAAYVFLNAVTRCSGDLIIHTKQIAAFRYVYFAEAAAFVALALFLSSKAGFYGLLSACLLCVVLFRGTYTTWRVAHYFKQPAKTLFWTWLRRPLLAGLLLAPFVAISSQITSVTPSLRYQLATALLLMAVPCGFILFKIALPQDVVKEVLAHLRKFRPARMSSQ